MRQEYVVLRDRNDYLKNFVGYTAKQKVLVDAHKFILEQHRKYQNGLGMPKVVVSCIDPKTNEILGIGGSSLLLHKKTGKIIPDLILDNFGNIFAGFFVAPGTDKDITAKDDAAASKTVRTHWADAASAAATYNNWVNAGASGSGSQIKMGSGTTAPARADTAIQTALVSAPESGYLDTNNGAYTVSNTVIYQADANPTGGSGTVNEAGTFGVWNHTPATPVAIGKFMITHDAVSPGVAFTAGKLLRAAYTWTL